MFSLFSSNVRKALLYLSLSASICLTVSTPAFSAEKIYLNYGLLELSISVKSLEAYATEDRLEGELAVYAGYFDEEDLVKLKQALLTPVEVDTVAIANFLYSPQGKVILEKVSKIIQTQAHQPGFYALRSALILASAEEEGLTLLNFLRQIPVRGLRINSLRGLEIIGDLRKIIKQTQKAIALVEQQQLVEQNQTPVSNFSLPDLREAGKQKFRRQVLTLRDKRRNRSFPVELYLPENNNREKLANLIVISHGLGSDRRSFAYLAQHLASYGFAVAVPEHPGSNAAQVEALFTGKSKQIPPRELIDRPLDIKYLLDELERNYKEQINVKEVGIIGQSFGAYTVLAVAGAELNYSNLQAGCQNLADTYNISLLLQCVILNEPPYPGKLRDERIVAAIAINPLASTIFGKEGLNKIKIPVMLVAGSADAVTPALAEQIIPFTWLNTADKYLALLGGGTHFSVIAESTGSLNLPPEVIGPDQKIAQTYLKALSLAFFKYYIQKQTQYKPYLSASYASTISNGLIPLSLIKSLPSDLELNP